MTGNKKSEMAAMLYLANKLPKKFKIKHLGSSIELHEWSLVVSIGHSWYDWNLYSKINL